MMQTLSLQLFARVVLTVFILGMLNGVYLHSWTVVDQPEP